MLTVGSTLDLDVEKAVAGGRMLCRHHGRIVLVSGAIPGERVRARVERSGRGVLYAEAIDVLSPSPDRREAPDARCGGNVLAHVQYERQLQLKAGILQDGMSRIGRIRLEGAPAVIGSPEHGYRMRARLHAAKGRLGFYREGTHDLCSAAATGQLLPQTNTWIADVEEAIRIHGLDGLAGIEIGENIDGTARAAHVDLDPGVDPARFAPLQRDLVGLSAQSRDRPQPIRLHGIPVIVDVLHVREGDPSSALRLRRDVRGFFQANRFLLEPLVRHVVALAPVGPVIDLYAGVGLFGLSFAAAGADHVTLVEGDPVTGSDLLDNAEPFQGQTRVERCSVEAFLASAARGRGRSGLDRSVSQHAGSREATVIVDPPRTGMSKEALEGVVRIKPTRLVYVSCDVPTLARDSRALLDAGYELMSLTAIDLFPNTAHVETVAVFAH